MAVEHHPNGVCTRPARADDQSRVFELIEQLTGEVVTSDWQGVYESHLRLERGAVVVAENNLSIVGIATVSYNMTIRYGGEYCELEELIVDDSARGLNLGRMYKIRH